MSGKPVRIQLSRRKGWRMPPNTVKVSRPGRFGNPFSVLQAAEVYDCRPASAHHYAVEWFREWVNLPNNAEQLDDLGVYGGTRDQHAKLHAGLPELRGKNLACFCGPEYACHADVLLEIANRPICDAPASGIEAAKPAEPKGPTEGESPARRETPIPHPLHQEKTT